MAAAKLRLVLFMALLPLLSSAQDVMTAYSNHIDQAEDAYIEKNYFLAVNELNAAFQLLGNKGYVEDRYLAARCWSLLNNPDSAFYQLQKLAEKTDFLTEQKLVKEQELDNLHTDPRWNLLIVQVNPQKEIYNDSLADVLDRIYEKDQQYRKEINSTRKKYGQDSPQMHALWDTINFYDSLNLQSVSYILDHYGWAGRNTVGEKGSQALWLVIQHAPLEVQEKYFPLMQNAVEKGKASKADLAYLQDRILMRHNKAQLYGTQYKVDPVTGNTELWKLEDAEHVNERRKEVGLPPMEDEHN